MLDMDMGIGSQRQEITVQASRAERTGVPVRVLGFLSRHSAFFSKWSEVNMVCACSTACVSCIGAAAGSVLIPLVAESRQGYTENIEADQEL